MGRESATLRCLTDKLYLTLLFLRNSSLSIHRTNLTIMPCFFPKPVGTTNYLHVQSLANLLDDAQHTHLGDVASHESLCSCFSNTTPSSQLFLLEILFYCFSLLFSATTLSIVFFFNPLTFSLGLIRRIFSTYQRL